MNDFLEFYNKNLMSNFYLDNIGWLPTLISITFVTILFVTIVSYWVKEDNSKFKFLIKTSLIMVLIYFIGNALFFNNYGIKDLYTTVFKSKEKTNYINYLNKDINENNDFKQMYTYIKHLKENSDKKNMDWNLFNEVSLINTKYYFNDYNNYNNNKENTKNKYFIDENNKVFSKEFGKNYKHFFNMFIFTEMIFIDKPLKEKVVNVIAEIEKDNVITNQEFFYLLNNIKEYIINFDYYNNKNYTQGSNRWDKEIENFENNILSDKEKQKKFINYLIKWSNNEMIIKDEQSFYERNVLRNLNNDYYIKYYYVGSKNSNLASYNFSFDTDELFTTLNNVNYKLKIKTLIKEINKDNNITNKEFVNLINDIYVLIYQERKLERKIYNTTESDYYDYYDKLKN